MWSGHVPMNSMARVILFWLPLVGGTVAFVSLRRGLNQPHRPDLCPA